MPIIEGTSTATWIASFKTFGYFAAIGAFEYLAIPTEQLWILAILMIIDFITWVGKQYRIDPKQIKSHIAWLGAMKKVATMISILSIALVLKGLAIHETQYLVAMLSIFITSEWYSTIQNVYAIRTGKILPEFDVISIVIKNAWEFFKQKIENMVKKSSNP